MTKKHLFQTTFIVLAMAFAQAATAVTLDPNGDDLAIDDAAPLIDNKQGFIWSATDGFAPTDLPSPDRGETLIGIVGADMPGQGLRWHPEYGLVPRNFVVGADDVTTPAIWARTGDATRVVIWNAEDLQALADQMPLVDGEPVTAVFDVSPNGTVLGAAGTDEPDFFAWNAIGGVRVLNAGQDAQIVAVSEISDSGYVLAEVSTEGGPVTSVLISPDGSVAPLSGPVNVVYRPTGMNETGVVVGSAATEPKQAVIWTAGRPAEPLAEKLSARLPDGFVLTDASDISNAGQIVSLAVTPEGATTLVLLTPDPASIGQYIPQVLGEIAAPGVADPITTLKVSEDGRVLGNCVFGAADCPINPLEFALLDPSITNLVNQADFSAGPLPLISSFAGRTATPFAAPAAALPPAGIGPVALNNPAGAGGAVPPDFGSSTFPTLTTTDPSSTSAPTSSTIPLPPAGFLLIFSLLALRYVARPIKAVRRGVATVLRSGSSAHRRTA